MDVGRNLLSASRLRAHAEAEKQIWPGSWTVTSDRARAGELEAGAALRGRKDGSHACPVFPGAASSLSAGGE